MPIPLGILAAAGFRPSAAGDFQLLESTTLTSNQSSVSFTNLASKYAATYQHLQLRIVGVTSADADIRYRHNSDTGNNYAFHALYGTGSSVVSGALTSTNGGYIGFSKLTSASGNQFGAVVDFLDPFETTKNTTSRAFYGNRHTSTDPLIMLNSSFWNNTSAVTSIEIYMASGTINSTSRFSLYGLRS
jgi:hypothetical protein